MKRFFDFLFSFVMLIILSPIFLVVSLILMFDGGPVLYKQVRVGRGGKEFKIFKFRSMVVNADKIGGYSTQVSDPRITKIGKILRKTSIDELPQLLNVLEGSMSIVGPRPNVPEQRADYTKHDWDLRNSVKPGITGLAQAKIRSAATAEERLKLDLEYIKKAGFCFDLWILLLTFKQVIFRGGY